MKKQCVLFLLALLPSMANAYDVEIDGICYNLVNKAKTAEIVQVNRGGDENGNFVIPETIVVDNTEYSVTSIGEKAFYGKAGLKTITIPKTIKYVGDYAFYYCTGLKAVYITDIEAWINISFTGNASNPLSCAKRLFVNGEELTTLVVPTSISIINDYTFENCQSLNSIVLTSNVTTIKGGAFRWCGNLQTVYVEGNLKQIGHGAFGFCNNLFSINLPNSVEFIDEQVFSGCKKLISINIPDKIESIGYGTFMDCESLKSIIIPNNVMTIGNAAFYNCKGLSEITIGNGISSVGDGAFAYCPEILDVYCYAEQVPSAAAAFGQSDVKYATLHVPASAINNYKSSASWNYFGTIMALKEKCLTPTIKYTNGVLGFECETLGSEFVSTITDVDVSTHQGNSINLTATYTINVYAVAEGYEKSDVATATLCWIDAEPKTEGITNSVANVRANAVLIQNNGGILSIQGVDENIPVYIYNISGHLVGSAKTTIGTTSINTTLCSGEVGIVKIGDKSIKVLIK